MADPRKPVFRPNAEQQSATRDVAYAYLLAATEEGAKAIGTTGVSFVLIGMGIWTSELTELDARATSKLMHALGDLFDPSANPAKKAHAEKRRRAAVDRLLAALDLSMAKTEGRG